MSVEPSELERQVENPVMDVAVMTAVSKAELDQQITTARAYPRSLKNFVSECRDMACLNEKVASECFYVLPRGGKNIEGPSVRLGEIVMSAWGNCQSGARVVEEGQDFITAQGVFYDLQRNVKITMEVRRRITDSKGRRFNADMIGVTGNAACSIALRNAIFRGIPKAFWQDIYEDAREVAKGNIKSLVTNRTAALDWLARRGVTNAVVLAALGVPGIEDIGLDELGTLKGMMTALKEGEATVETIFAPKDAPAGKPPTDKPKSKSEVKAEADAKAATDVTAKGSPESTPAAESQPATETKAADTKASHATAEQSAAKKPLSPLQVTALLDKAKTEGVKLDKLLDLYSVTDVKDLPFAEFKICLAWIDTEANVGH